MRNTLNKAAVLTLAMIVAVGCGRKDKGDGDGGDEPTDTTTDENTDTSNVPTFNPLIGDSFDLAVGCTGEEVTASLLAATGLVMSKLPTDKQQRILAAQSRLPGERNLELSTAAHITNKLNLTAEIADTFSNAWFGDPGTEEYAAITALYGPFPAGDRLSYIFFGKAFYERLYGGTADGASVGAMGSMLDSLDATATNPADETEVPAEDDVGKVAALVIAIGSTMCIN